MADPKSTHTASTFRLRPGERRTLLLIGDFSMAAIALVIALYYWARGDQWLDFSLEFMQNIPGWFYLLPLAWMLLLVELYEEHRAASTRFTLQRIFAAAVLGLGLYLLIYFTSEPKSLPRRGVIGFVVAASALTLVWRLLYIRIFTAPRFMRRVLLVGAGVTGTIILKVYKEAWPLPFYLAGIIDDDPQKIDTQIEGFQVFGGSDILLDTIEAQGISDLIVAISGEMQGRMFQALLDAQERGIEITRMPVAYEEILGRVPIRYLEADWILRSFVDQARVSAFFEIAKRLLDILGGLAGVAIMLMLLPMIALAIVLDSGFPIFYSQCRSGRGDRHYRIYKFRTMRQNAEADGQPQWAEESDPRATRVGLFLRKTHIDELPQFINVLRGDMSLVGPRAERPELVAYFQQYVPFYRARLLVKPGITGWAQINYGYASNVEETIVKLEHDLYYIKRRSLGLDLLIMLRTPATMLGFKGR
jgi:exopolysaccharide biosynthesis polyprenyl glycosylphosphotransferase